MPGYPASSFGPSRFQIEANDCTDPNRLDELSRRKSNFVQSAVAANSHTPSATLARLAASQNPWTRSAVAKNPNTPSETLMGLAVDSEPSVRAKVGYNHNAPVEALRALAGDIAVNARIAAAWNHATDAEVLTRLGTDVEETVRAKVAKNPNTPTATLVTLAGDTSFMVRSAMTERGFNPDAPTQTVWVRRFNGRHRETYQTTRRIETGGRYSTEVIRAFAHGTDVKMHFRAAAQPDAPEDALIHLATTSTVDATLRILAENPNASARVLYAVAQRREIDSLKAVAVHPNTDEETLGMLALSSSRSAHAAIAHSRPGGMAWLAGHADPKIRVVAAKQVGDYTGTSDPEELRSLLAALLADQDASVQVAAAQSISSDDLANFVEHPNPQVRKVVAERSPVPNVLARLAGDQRPLVRRAVARNQQTPVDALAMLAADPDARTRADAARRFLAALAP